MPIGIDPNQGIVLDVGVEVEALRVGHFGVGHRLGLGCPVGGEKAAEAGGVVAGVEVVVACFRVALLGGEDLSQRRKSSPCFSRVLKRNQTKKFIHAAEAKKIINPFTRDTF